MLDLERNVSVQGLTVYRDDKRNDLFYPMPAGPTFRIGPNGKPVFLFIMYRNPIPRPGGKQGGGFLICDVEFTIPQAQMDKVKVELQNILNDEYKGRPGSPKAPPIQIARPYFKRGAATVQVLDQQGGLVQQVRNPASPTLYGTNVLPITVEFDQFGAAIAMEALKGQGASIVQVAYNLVTDVALPPMQAFSWFYAEKFYEFHQSVQVDWHMYGDDNYRESIEEKWRSMQVGGVRFDWGSVTDEKVKTAIRDQFTKANEERIKQSVLGDIAGVPEDKRGVPEGIENVWRDVKVSKSATFFNTYTEGTTIEWDAGGRGTIPSLASMGIKPDEYFILADPDHPFFRTLSVTTRVNADFQALPLAAVKIHIDYPGGKPQPVYDKNFTSAADIDKYEAFVVPSGSRKYKYWYEAHYKGASRSFKSTPVETDETDLMVDVGDAGLLTYRVEAGDLDWEQVRAAQVTVSYPGPTPIVRKFTLDPSHTTFEFAQAIFQPINRKLSVQTKFNMKNGKEITRQEDMDPPILVIDDVFANTKTLTIVGTGLGQKIEMITVEVAYKDETNSYAQAKTLVLTSDQPSVEWSFPVISDMSGKVTYQGVIKNADGTEDPIDPTEATTGYIILGGGTRGRLEVTVNPDLMFDNPDVKLVSVALKYDDPPALSVRKTFVFRQGATEPQTWTVDLKHKDKLDYTWQATFFMMSGGQRKTDAVTTEEDAIFPEFPPEADEAGARELVMDDLMAFDGAVSDEVSREVVIDETYGMATELAAEPV